jgi:hypothetical protein
MSWRWFIRRAVALKTKKQRANGGGCRMAFRAQEPPDTEFVEEKAIVRL